MAGKREALLHIHINKSLNLISRNQWQELPFNHATCDKEPQGEKGEEVPHIQDRSLSKINVSLIVTKYGQKKNCNTQQIGDNNYICFFKDQK